MQGTESVPGEAMSFIWRGGNTLNGLTEFVSIGVLLGIWLYRTSNLRLLSIGRHVLFGRNDHLRGAPVRR